jgi:hypothetical protein
VWYKYKLIILRAESQSGHLQNFWLLVSRMIFSILNFLQFKRVALCTQEASIMGCLLFFNYSRTPLIRNNVDDKPPEYSEIRITVVLFANLKFGCYSLQYVQYTYLRLNLSPTSDLKFQKPYHCIVPDPITGYFKASSFCRILDKITRSTKSIRITTVQIIGVLRGGGLINP